MTNLAGISANNYTQTTIDQYFLNNCQHCLNMNFTNSPIEDNLSKDKGCRTKVSVIWRVECECLLFTCIAFSSVHQFYKMYSIVLA